MTRASLALAVSALLVVPAAAGAAPGEPTCAADKMLTLTLKTRERGFSAQLVAAHDQSIVAEWSGDARRSTLSVPAGIDVVKQTRTSMRLLVPASAALPVTVTWEQAIDPSNPDHRADEPSTRCNAGQTVTLPILAPRRSRAYYGLMPDEDIGGFANFAVATDPTAADLSPLSVTVRTTSAARFPPRSARAKRMPVPLSAEDLRRYKKRLPNPTFSPTPVMCRAWWICNSLLTADVDSLADRRPGARITKRYLKGSGLPLPSTQPYKRAAPFGIKILTYPSQRQPPTLGYDIQVRQAGRLVARVRRAVRCRKDPRFFNNLVCRTVKKKNG
jgi:hypothetical protein